MLNHQDLMLNKFNFICITIIFSIIISSCSQPTNTSLPTPTKTATITTTDKPEIKYTPSLTPKGSDLMGTIDAVSEKRTATAELTEAVLDQTRTIIASTPTRTSPPTQTPYITTDTGFKVDSSVNSDERSSGGIIFFLDDYAVVLSRPYEGIVIFNLPRMEWLEVETNESVRFSDCMEWAEASAEITKESLAESNDDKLNSLVISMLEPNFDVRVDDNEEIILENEFLVYKVIPLYGIDESALEKLYIYDQMNACRKSIIQQQLPPFAQLALIEELKRRNVFPSEVEFTMKSTEGDIHLSTQNILGELNEIELSMVLSILENNVEY